MLMHMMHIEYIEYMEHMMHMMVEQMHMQIQLKKGWATMVQ